MDELKETPMREIVVSYFRHAEKEAILRDKQKVLEDLRMALEQQLELRENELSLMRGVKFRVAEVGKDAKPIKEEMMMHLIKDRRSELTNTRLDLQGINHKIDAELVELRVLNKKLAKLSDERFEQCLSLVNDLVRMYEMLNVKQPIVSAENAINAASLCERMKSGRKTYQLSSFRQEKIRVTKPPVPKRSASLNEFSYQKAMAWKTENLVDYENGNIRKERVTAEVPPCVFEPDVERTDCVVRMDTQPDESGHHHDD